MHQLVIFEGKEGWVPTERLVENVAENMKILLLFACWCNAFKCFGERIFDWIRQ